jgi:signal transduction histidine kinase
LFILYNRIDRVVLFYTDDVKVRKFIKKNTFMRPDTSPDYLNCRFNRDVEDQFNNSGEFFNQAIENADGVPYQLIFASSIGDGYFAHVGNGIEMLLGISPAGFTERHFLQMIEEVIPLQENIPLNPVELREKIIRREIRKYKAEIRLITARGENKWIKDCSLPVVDEKTGSVIGLMGIFFDISDQKHTLLLLEKALERATESDRLKTAFLNNLSHEIRTPLNAIVGFSTLLFEPGQVPGNRTEFIDIVTHSSDHLLEIVDDVVEISKIETGNVRIILKEVNLDQMLTRVYNRFKPLADEKKILLSYDTKNDLNELILYTDGYKLFQSIVNLVSNAVKFTFEGKVEFGYRIKGDRIEFYVSDTGIGIGLEHQPHIFKPFYQAENSTNNRYEGTGLGLSIAPAYIELLGGEIWYNSEPGEGSVFCFNIPDSRS